MSTVASNEEAVVYRVQRGRKPWRWEVWGHRIQDEWPRPQQRLTKLRTGKARTEEEAKSAALAAMSVEVAPE